MNNKKIMVIVLGALVIIGGAIFVLSQRNTDDNQQNTVSMNKTTGADAMMSDTSTENTATTNSDEKAMMNNDTMTAHGSYKSQDEYEAMTNEETTTIYFFHASWCPICQAIDKQLLANDSLIPAGFTIVKTDFDSATDLRKKYGVTTQYTFVQVDSNGNETAQWTASNIDDVIAGIKP